MPIASTPGIRFLINTMTNKEAFIALNMIDVAEKNGHQIDSAQLGQALGVPVFPMVATTGQGIDNLRPEIRRRFDCDDLTPTRPRCWTQRQRELLAARIA